MAIDLSTVSVKLQATGMSQVKGAFADISKEAATVKKNIVDLLSPSKAVASAIAGIGAAFTAAAITGFLKSSIDEARDAEDKLTQLKTAVENTGVAFDKWKDKTDAAADGLEKVTKYSDEAARGALTTLITISGNVQGSLKNLGVTADLAAARHIDLEQAAQLVGKAMIGNVTALGKMGIKAKEGADIMEVLRQKVQGFAENDAQTLTGRLDQVSNAWLNVKEAIGRAILNIDTVGGKTNWLRDKLIDTKNYIEQNSAKWRDWARVIRDDVVRAFESMSDWLGKVSARFLAVAADAQIAGLAINFAITRNPADIDAIKRQMEIQKQAAADYAKIERDATSRTNRRNDPLSERNEIAVATVPETRPASRRRVLFRPSRPPRTSVSRLRARATVLSSPAWAGRCLT